MQQQNSRTFPKIVSRFNCTQIFLCRLALCSVLYTNDSTTSVLSSVSAMRCLLLPVYTDRLYTIIFSTSATTLQYGEPSLRTRTVTLTLSFWLDCHVTTIAIHSLNCTSYSFVRPWSLISWRQNHMADYSSHALVMRLSILESYTARDGRTDRRTAVFNALHGSRHNTCKCIENDRRRRKYSLWLHLSTCPRRATVSVVVMLATHLSVAHLALSRWLNDHVSQVRRRWFDGWC